MPNAQQKTIEWSKWVPTILVVIGWAFAAGIAYSATTELRHDIALIDAAVKAHVNSEGHVKTMRRLDKVETEARHTEDTVRGLDQDMDELRRLMRRVDRRTEALCADSPRCRKGRE